MAMRTLLLFVLLVVPGFAACQSGPRPLRVGEDVCTHCRMGVADPAFGGELVTRTGKVLTFDGAECLVAYLAAHPDEAAAARGTYVVPADVPGTLVPAEGAFFLRGGRVQSPMGAGLAAYSTDAARREAQTRLGGTTMTWAEVRRALASDTAHTGRHR